MKILVLTNLYPPHHAGTHQFRCEVVTDLLRLRGHQALVLTSTHGLRSEQRDAHVERRLLLNGLLDHPLVTPYSSLKQLETHNHGVLNDVIASFQPDVIHVWSLQGLSKSLVFSLRNSRVPTVYDIADDWLAEGVAEDPWLRWWNSPSTPFASQAMRASLEMSGGRNRLDLEAPTRMQKGYDRIPELFGNEAQRSATAPNSISAFRLDRLYFCSHALKARTGQAGFKVAHADVIYPGIQTELFVGEVKPASIPVKRLLVVSRLTPEGGVMTALRALQIARANKLNLSLGIYGRGETSHIAELRSFAVMNQLPVEFLTVSNQQKDQAAIYVRHDALLYTAEWPEPFPITPLEAMAAGLPVIGARSGGAAELLRHGENALTFVAGQADELAARLQEMQLQPALRVQMAETAQAEVLSRHNESIVTDQVENYLVTSQEIWAQAAT